MGNAQVTALIYCRTSTAGQKDERTIDSQKEWAREQIKRDRVRLLPYGPSHDGWLVDDGITGSLLEGRLFKGLIDDIEAGRATPPDFLYVISTSRLARQKRTGKDKKQIIQSRIDAARIAGVLGAYGVMIRDETGTKDPNSLAYDVQESVSTEEYRGIRSRTMRGKARVLGHNAVATGGRPPYGYRRVPIEGDRKKGTTYAQHAEDAPRFQKLMDWYVAGGVSHAARTAMKAGWLSPRGSKTWYPSTVQQMLNNIRAYLGEATRSIDGQVFTVKYEPLIDLRTYAAITRRMKERTLKHRTTLLSTGYVDCACGAHIHGHRSASTQRFVVICGKRQAGGSGRASCGSIREDVLRSRLWAAVVARLVQIQEHDKIVTGGPDPYGVQLEAARGKLAAVQAQIDRIVELYAEDAIDRIALNRNNERLREQKAALQADVERLERARDGHAQKKLGQESVQARVQSVLHKLRKGCVPLGAKRDVLRELLDGERVVVGWRKSYAALTLPAFADLPPVTVRTDRSVWEQVHGAPRKVVEEIYNASDPDGVEDFSMGEQSKEVGG